MSSRNNFFDPEIDNPGTGSLHSNIHSHLVSRDYPDRPNFPFFQNQNEILEIEKYAPISASDFELVKKAEEIGFLTSAYNIDKFLPDLAEARASLKGVAGHQIHALITSQVRNIRARRFSSPLLSEQTSLKPYEKAVIEEVSTQIMGQYRSLSVDNAPEVVREVWQKLRQRYTFVKLIPNSTRKPLIDGAIFHQGWVEDTWNSDRQKGFEEDVFTTYQNQISNYLNTDLFEEIKDSNQLPTETEPLYDLTIEQPTISHIWFGSHKIQFKGQVDLVLSNSVDRTKYFVLIDNKFGDPSGLFNPINRVQVLNYCHGVASGEFSKTDIDWVRPENTMFLYQVIDTRRKVMHYVNATITANEYRDIMAECQRLTSLWYDNYELLRTIRKVRAEAMVTPHLPHPEELIRPAQRKLFLI